MEIKRIDGRSFDIEQNKKEQLRAIFPECFSDGKLDIDKLLNLCGEYIEPGQEKYEFKWAGKSESYKHSGQRSTGTLRPCREDSVNFDTTKNIYIEGDNLEVLKLLQTAYFRKIKMIYIDPPYNTGNDFVYEDDYKDPIEKYKEITQQTTKSNPETMGRYHTNWLNMMYPRLRVAANLLRDDGVIFISIDDNEVHNLRKLCDEVFGEENFRNQITIRRGAKSVQAQFDTWDKLGQDIEHILFYTKNSNYRFPKQTKKLDEKRGGTWNNHWRGTDRPTMRYELFGITPQSGQWRWGKERSLQAVDNYKNMLIELNETEETITNEKIDEYYLKKGEEFDLLRLSKTGKPEHYVAPTDSTLLNTSWQDLLVGSSSEILDLFDTKVFDTAKLTTVIRRMLGFGDKDNNDIILDFFSGSATTGQAVMMQNAEDGGNRQFILVQLPELCNEKSDAYKSGYTNICQVGEERLRRAGKKIAEQNPNVDVGFRVFKLDTSNLVKWDSTPTDDTEELKRRFLQMKDSLVAGRTSEDLVYEVMLKLGIPLDYSVNEIKVNNKQAFSIGEDCLVLVCVDKEHGKITPEDIEAMCEYAPAKIVTSEEAFADDSALSNAFYILKDRDIEMEIL
mgnify:CR=1 FL=1